ncbi:MAG: Hsp20/alpha crystallin family protein [Armatimonadota bacterium]
MKFTHFATPDTRAIDSLNSAALLRTLASPQSPAVNIGETDGTYHITVELPGMSAEHVNVDVQGRTISIHGTYPETDAEFRSLVAERPAGTFARTFQLPLPVDGNAVTASFDRGVLEITLPKAEESKVKRITIS